MTAYLVITWRDGIVPDEPAERETRVGREVRREFQVNRRTYIIFRSCPACQFYLNSRHVTLAKLSTRGGEVFVCSVFVVWVSIIFYEEWRRILGRI